VHALLNHGIIEVFEVRGHSRTKSGEPDGILKAQSSKFKRPGVFAPLRLCVSPSSALLKRKDAETQRRKALLQGSRKMKAEKKLRNSGNSNGSRLFLSSCTSFKRRPTLNEAPGSDFAEVTDLF